MKHILLFSGGLDSTVALYSLLAKGHEVCALSINYGQRHKKELDSAKSIADSCGVPFHILDLGSVQALISGSSQTGNIEVPDGHYTEESMKLTVVPNRNMIMLSLAIGWAVNLKFDSVVYAAHTGDHAIYPDCRKEFIESMDASARLCDWHPVQVIAPFQDLTKDEIVREGARLGVAFEKTWSCYKGLHYHCGKCGTCTERKEAFAVSGIKDPTIYLDEINEQSTLSSKDLLHVAP